MDSKRIAAGIQIPKDVFESALETVYLLRLELTDDEFIARIAMAMVLAEMYLEEKIEENLKSYE